MNPKVSIIIPVYNLERYIGKTLKSVLGQTYTNLEVIVIDDHSSDNTLSVIHRFSDKRLRVIKQEKNMGVSKARNVGISSAIGEYIQFVDGDDLLENNAIEKLIRIAISNKSDIVCFNLKVISDGENHLSLREKRYSKQNTEQQIVNNQGALKLLFLDKIKHTPPTYLFKRKLWCDSNIQFPTDRQYGEDFATIYKVLDVADTVVVIPDRLYYYVQRPSSSTHKADLKFAVDNLKTTYEIDDHFANYNSIIKDLAIRYTIPRLITAFSIASKVPDKTDKSLKILYKIRIELIQRTKKISYLKRTFNLNTKFKLILNDLNLLHVIFKIRM